ncbi:hypothetical protein D9619_002411 [Psilocybe cf. subviscida]|uniref:F-box domain-containing protein n=1 Tax=Psilocybe cf. subviscida TaxID=2480587 RepID=A0A8H5AYJ9_9AGAR|nr:hypothetical protein D9619_002411 [Psilocybe cf. subviscida]
MTGATGTETVATPGIEGAVESNIEHNEKYDPFNCLPPEIVARIFHASIATHTDDAMAVAALQDENTESCMRPFQLAWVCQRWRHIAMAAPTLWTLLVMDRRGKEWTLPLDLVQQWITRTGALPLRIVLRWEPSGNPLDENLVSLVKHLCKYSSRWRSVMFHIPGEIIPFFHSETDITVDLDVFYLDSPTNASHGWNMGQTILRPRLASFLGLPVPPQSLQWSRTASINMSSVFVSDCLQIMGHCNNAIHLRVLLRRSIMGHLLDRPIPPSPIIMQHLRRLEVLFIDDFDMFLLMKRIHTPSLRSLKLGALGSEDLHTPIILLQDFFVEVADHLTSLSLGRVSFKVPHLEVVLSMLNTLVELTIIGDESGGPSTSLDPLFIRLTSTLSADSPPSFLPKLRRFMYMGIKKFTWDAVATILESHVCQQYNPALDTPFKRPLTVFNIDLTRPGAVDNLVDREVLLRFLRLPPSWMKISMGEKLMQASLEHHGVDHQTQHPTFRRHAY